MIFNTDESEAMNRQCVANILSMNINAVVSMDNKLDLRKYMDRDLFVVYVDRRPDSDLVGKNTAFLLSDHEKGGYLAGQELARCGCKRVSCITGLENSPATAMRNRGFLRACQEYDMEILPELMYVPDEISMETGYKIVNQAIQNGNQFDGIFCETDWLAIGALSALLDHRFSIPRDVQVIGFDDIRAARITQCPLTTIHQFSAEMGTKAAQVIFDYVEDKRITCTEIILPVELRRRGTTKLL